MGGETAVQVEYHTGGTGEGWDFVRTASEDGVKGRQFFLGLKLERASDLKAVLTVVARTFAETGYPLSSTSVNM
jgi:hypothetical protein